MPQAIIEKFTQDRGNGSLIGDGPWEILGRASEEAAINIGDALIRGTDAETQVKLPAGALFADQKVFMGFAMLPNKLEKTIANAAGDVAYELYDGVSCLVDGYGGVQCESAFTAGQICQVVVIAAGAVAAQTVNRLTATVDATNAQPINATFESSGAAGEVAKIRVHKQI